MHRLAATHTHLYPGALLRCIDEDDLPPRPAGDALVEFSDGQAVPARLDAGAGTEARTATLAVQAHATARGAAIAAKRWRLRWRGDGSAPESVRVEARLA